MKYHLVVISFFLLAVGVVVLGAKAKGLEYLIAKAPANKTSVNELLTDQYVENVLNESGEFKEGEDSYIFNNVSHKTPINLLRSLALKSPPSLSVLGATTDQKHIVVDLAHQRAYAYEGNRVVFNFLVSTGYWAPTPTGHYTIWYKVRSQTMKGGDPAKGDYYYLPNVQFVQFFNKGISFHSTYWHNNFGTPMSHGCVNMTLTDAETLYYWANPEMPAGVRILRPTPENPGTPVDVVSSWTI